MGGVVGAIDRSFAQLFLQCGALYPGSKIDETVRLRITLPDIASLIGYEIQQGDDKTSCCLSKFDIISPIVTIMVAIVLDAIWLI